MPLRKLGPEAFDFYFNLGAQRSYQSVADHYGVAKRTVTNAARKEKWKERIEKIEKTSQEEADKKSAKLYEQIRLKETKRLRDLQNVFQEVLTPDRLKALVVALFKSAIQRDDNRAMKILLERLLGRPRSEPLQPNSFSTPEGLETTADVRTAANSLLKAVSQGLLAPEDAQRAISVVEAARRSIETDELEKRIAEVELQLQREEK